MAPKPTKKIYIIVEVNWEYNDEYYYRPEGGGGSPIEAYYDEAKAKKRCAVLNKKDSGMTMEDDNGENEEGEYGSPAQPLYEVKTIDAPKA